MHALNPKPSHANPLAPAPLPLRREYTPVLMALHRLGCGMDPDTINVRLREVPYVLQVSPAWKGC